MEDSDSKESVEHLVIRATSLAITWLLTSSIIFAAFPPLLQSATAWQDPLSWSTTTPLASGTGNAQLGTFAYQNRIYQVSGIEVQGSTNTWRPNVDFANINSDGTLGNWSPTTPLPQPRTLPGVVVYGNRVYAIGGNGGGSQASDVWFASINADGTLSAWTTTTSLPKSLQGHQAVVVGNRIYVLGGYDGYSKQNSVYYSTINGDGTLTGWATTAPLPQALTQGAAVASNSRIYYAGGGTQGSSGPPTSVVYVAPVNPDGTITSWSTTTSLPQSRWTHRAVLIVDTIYVLGGCTDLSGCPTTSATSSVIKSTVQSDGTLSAWTSDTSLPEPKSDPAVAATSAFIYSLGGGPADFYTVFLGKPASFDFSVSSSPNVQAIVPNWNLTYRIGASLISGTAQSVSLSAAGLPPGASVSFSPLSGTPPFRIWMTITTSATTPPGTYTITITGTSGSITRQTQVSLIVVTGNDLFGVPVGGRNKVPTSRATDVSNLLVNLNLNNQGQTVQVDPGVTVSGTITFQRYSGSDNPSEIQQAFLIMSWTPSWPPPSQYYIPLYDSVPGNFPGTTQTKTFSFTAPTSAGTYYLFYGGSSQYSMSQAIAEWTQKLDPPGVAKIIVNQMATTGNIQVTVRDQNGYTLSGATVTSTSQPNGQNPLSGSTDSNGQISWNNILTGPYVFQASKGGYTANTGSATVSAGQTTSLTISLSVGATYGSVQVTIKDNSGAVLPATTITSIQSPSGQNPLSGVTDSSGQYTWNNVLTGTYTFQASKTGYVTNTGSITVSSGQTASITINLTPTATYGNIQVVVKDASGTALQGSTVSSLQTPPGQSSLSGTTDSTGQYIWNNVLTGSYTIQASLGGYSTNSGSGVVNSGQTTSVVITLAAIPKFGFKIDVSPPSRTVVNGEAATYSVSISLASGSTQQVSLSVSGLSGNVGSYSFNPPSGSPSFTSTLTINTLSSAALGQYDLVLTGTGGGYTASSAIRLTINPRPTLQVTLSPNPTTVASGGSSIITAAVITSDGRNPPLTFAWSVNGGSLVSASSNPVTWVAPMVSSPTTYLVSVTVSSPGYLSASSSSSLTVRPQPSLAVTISVNPGTIISGGSGTITATVTASDGSNPSVSYAWTNGGGVISSFNSNPVIWTAPSVSSQTVYHVTVAVSAVGYIQGSAYLDITVLPPPTYTVTFLESGLPAGSSWTITFNGQLYSSTTTTIAVSNTRAGSYPWSSQEVDPCSGCKFTPRQMQGTISVPSVLSQFLIFDGQYLVSFVASPPQLGQVYPAGNMWFAPGAIIPIAAQPMGSTTFVFDRWGVTGSLVIGATIVQDKVAESHATVNGPGTITAYFVDAWKGSYVQTYYGDLPWHPKVVELHIAAADAIPSWTSTVITVVGKLEEGQSAIIASIGPVGKVFNFVTKVLGGIDCPGNPDGSYDFTAVQVAGGLGFLYSGLGSRNTMSRLACGRSPVLISSFSLPAPTRFNLVFGNSILPYAVNNALAVADNAYNIAQTVINLFDPQGRLYLAVQDGQGRTTGVYPGSNTTLAQIPGSFYAELGPNMVVVLPDNVTSFRYTVDASFASRPLENYSVTVGSTSNGTLVSKVHQSTIQRGAVVRFEGAVGGTGVATIPLYSVTLTVNDEFGLPVSDATATVISSTGKVATLTTTKPQVLPAGSYLLTWNYRGQSVQEALNINQDTVVTFQVLFSNYVLLIILAILLLGATFFVARRRRKSAKVTI